MKSKNKAPPGNLPRPSFAKKAKNGGMHPNTVAGSERWHEKRKETGVFNPTYRELMAAEPPSGAPSPRPDGKVVRQPLFTTRPGLYQCIMQLVQEGHHLATVANAVGIKAGTVMSWLKRGAKGKHSDYVTFLKDFQAAEAVAEVNRFNTLRQDGEGDWKSSAWILERRYPERWAKQTDRNVASPITINGDKVLVQQKFSSAVLADPAARAAARDLVSRTMITVVEGD
jgi:hypothetical protein|tara:strand:+ start:20644 stop:21324 length:681 start_codon:yes stop_codon:yes gene_type:complete